LYGNGCGYVNKSPGIESNDDFPFPFDAVAAVSDFDSRLIEGACGTCFEIKCVTGPVLWSYDQDDKVRYGDSPGFYEQASNATDTYGRRVPKRNAEVFLSDDSSVPYDAEYARCWNESETLFVKIVDKCPCEYFYEQKLCCGPIPHFDLSYWAHEKLTHPVQGKTMIRFRPVRCDAKRTPVDARSGAAGRMHARAVSSNDGVLSRADVAGQRVARFGGGFFKTSSEKSKKNKPEDSATRTVTVFENGPAPGWLLSAYGDRFLTLFKPTSFPSAHDETMVAFEATNRDETTVNATCFVVRPGGRLLARCERCEEKLKPFAWNDGRAVSFHLKVTKYVDAPHASAGTRVPRPCVDLAQSQSPPVYIGISTTGPYDFVKGSAPAEKPCGAKARTPYCAPAVTVFLDSLGCGGRAAETANSVFLELGQEADGEYEICVNAMRIESIR
jgi:hypothetical protein